MQVLPAVLISGGLPSARLRLVNRAAILSSDFAKLANRQVPARFNDHRRTHPHGLPINSPAEKDDRAEDMKEDKEVLW